ncbi:hypothetical protein DOY81_012633, partial [Sarcophaga bullata]
MAKQFTPDVNTMFDSFQTRRNRDRYHRYNDEIRTNENQTSILLSCKGNDLYVNDEMFHKSQLTCQKLMWSIYENNKIRKGCNEHTGATAFSLATKTNSAHHLLAEMCFDLKNWSLKSITYKATAPSDDVEELRDVMKAQLQKVDFIGTDLWNLKSTNNFNMTDLDLREQIKFDFEKKPIPAYIWTYLTSIDNTNRDFVIVGYNSPYAEFFYKSEIVFCADICNEIPWLKKISSSFSYAAAGIMFCCSTEAVDQFKNLDGFPMDVLISRSLSKEENKTEIEDFTANSSITSPEEIIILDAEMA